MKYTLVVTLFTLILSIHNVAYAQEKITAVRLKSNPVITPAMLSGDDGENINGPSLIKVPGWIKNPLGKYYLYFANHEGKYIRLAYSNNIKGPWKIYNSGTLKMTDCICNFRSENLSKLPHIASPDVLIDDGKKEIAMYFHCPVHTGGADSIQNYPQVSLRATSKNGIDFQPEKEILGDSYFRVFKWNHAYYAIAKTGILYRSKNGMSNFEKGPNPFLSIQNPSKLRHAAVLIQNNILYVFYSRIGDMPERILVSTIHLNNDWNAWVATEPTTVLEPMLDYEGVNEPVKKSVGGESALPVHELRDPAIFVDGHKIYLLYSIAGEMGIAIAEIKLKE
jgi:hypothetical protein